MGEGPRDGPGATLTRPGRFLKALRARLTRSPNRRTQSVLLIIAAVGFVVGAAFSWQSLELSLSELSLTPLVVLVVILVPVTVSVNVAEFMMIARVTGTTVPAGFGFRTVVIATAANLLPIPGSALVRVQALRAKGVPYRRGSAATAAAGVIWIAVSLLAAAWGVGLTGHWLPGAAFLGGATVAAVGGLGLLRPAAPDGLTTRLVAQVVGVETALVAAQFVRVVLVLLVFRVDAVLEPALVLTVSSALASAVGVFPGGLGISEAIAAGLSPLVSLSPAVGFAATGANRLAGLLLIAPVAAALGVRNFTADLGAGEEERPS